MIDSCHAHRSPFSFAKIPLTLNGPFGCFSHRIASGISKSVGA